MPQTGEVKKAREIGYKSLGSKYIWAACVDCGKERWVRFNYGKPANLRCPPCAMKNPEYKKQHSEAQRGERGSRWKGGQIKDSGGYIRIWLSPDDFFAPMRNAHGYVLEHRLVMAKKLKRCLLKGEKVHHRDGIKDHNTDENLELISQTNHALYNQLCVHCGLRKGIRLLRWQVKELTHTLQEKLKI